MRLRVILGAPLEEWHGTAAEWVAVPDRILFVQVERMPGVWMDPVFNGDWYWLRFLDDGRLEVGTALDGRRHVLGPDGSWEFEKVTPPIPPEAKAGVLVDADEWAKARDLARYP